MIFIQETSTERLFRKSFCYLFDEKKKPFIPDLIKEDSAVLILDSPSVTPYVVFNPTLAQIDYDFSSLIPEGSKTFEIEYWHYYYELIQSGKLDNLIKHMQSNPYSKRGVIGLWKEEYKNSGQPAPCLVNLSFLRREDRLCVHAHMRANDALKIFLIDFSILRSIQKLVADSLKLEIGTYIHFVDTYHIYRKDLVDAEKLYKSFQG